MSLKTIKCPHCGYVYKIDLETVVEDGLAVAVRGTDERRHEPVSGTKIDLTCPNCGKVFVWPIR